MTAAEVEDDPALAEQDETADERLANLPGSVVLVSGRDAGGQDAIAIWLAASSGRPTGAWVPTRATLAADPELARGLVRTVASRAVLGSTAGQACDLFAELTRYAGAEVDLAPERVASLPEAVEDLRDARQRCEEALTEARETSRQKLAPLAWVRDVGLTSVGSSDDVRRLARLGRPAGAPAPAEALTIVAGLRWVTAAWLEVEQMRRRRPALRDSMPRITSVPTRLAAAMGQTA